MVDAGLARTVCNARTNRIRRAFKWAVAGDLGRHTVAGVRAAIEGGRVPAGVPAPYRPDLHPVGSAYRELEGLLRAAAERAVDGLRAAAERADARPVHPR